MDLCETILAAGDDLSATVLLAAKAQEKGDALGSRRLFKAAIAAAVSFQAVSDRARTTLATAKAEALAAFAHEKHPALNAPVPANDHAGLPDQPGPMIA